MDQAMLRRLIAGLCLACLPVAGCATLPRPTDSPDPAQIHTASKPDQPIQLASHEEVAAAVPKEVPITLDAVLRIAEESNAKIGTAREKLNESQIAAEQAYACWMPNVYAGIAYYRHEGGIQDFNGNLVHSSYGSVAPGLQIKGDWDVREITFRRLDAERKTWQEKAELSRVNNEVLVEAAQTYVELITARRAESLSLELKRYEQKILARTERLGTVEASYDAIVAGLRSSISGREYQAAKLRQEGDAASAKLVYLLGLPPLTKLMPVDPVLVPIELIDTVTPTEAMVEQALTSGPGVQELIGLLNTIQAGLDQSYSKRNLLPTVGVCAWEGLFLAGPGGSLSGDNRLDVGLTFTWNLTELAQAEEKRRLVRSRLEQTRWTLKDVKDRLAAGVQEAKGTILGSRELLGLSTMQIKQASEAYRLADKRVEEGVKGASPTDVVTTIKALESAHFNYVQATRDHNKAQVRLLLLVGHPPAKEKPLASPVGLPPPEPLKGKRELPEENKNKDRDEKLPLPKDVGQQLPAPHEIRDKPRGQ